MSAERSKYVTHEREVRVPGGWTMLFVNIALLIAGVALFISTVTGAAGGEIGPGEGVARFIAALLIEGLGIFMLTATSRCNRTRRAC